MKIKRITFSNILSYGNKRNVIEFGDDGELLGIVGNNGMGKSSISDAVCYALYGNPFRKITKPNLINRINGKELYTKIEFENNNIDWIIERGMNPSIIKVWKNGVEVKLEAHMIDIQKYINLNVTCISENIFRTIVMVQMRNFKSFFTLSKDKRRELFESAVDISVLSNMRKFFQTKLTEAERNYNSKIIEEKYSDEKIKSLRENIKRINDISNESLTDTENQLSIIQNEYNEIKTKHDSLYKPLTEYETKHSQICKDIHNIEFQNNEYNRQLDIHNKDLEFYNLNDVCFRCKHKLTEQEKIEQINLVNVEIEKINKERLNLYNEYIRLEEDKDVIEQTINKCKISLKKISDQEFQINTLLNKKKEYISVHSSSKLKDDLEANLSEEIERNKLLKDDISENKNNIEISNNFKYILSDDGLKKYIYMKFLPILNYYVNEILTKFEFNIKFVLEESLEEKIFMKTGEEVKVDTFSSGEQQLIDVAFMFGLQRFLEKINNFNNRSIFIDELFDASIDIDNLDKIISFIKSLNKQVTIITHKNNIKEYFDTTYNIRKEGSFSQIYKDS